jgi:hypothetical protein
MLWSPRWSLELTSLSDIEASEGENGFGELLQERMSGTTIADKMRIHAFLLIMGTNLRERLTNWGPAAKARRPKRK